ncbi:MAG: hypothetical protein Q9213_008148 [Squamulea squamosa]
MSSGFISGGTTDKPIERDDEWLKAQQEIEANRRRKEEKEKQEGGKSLFEILQNNKGDFAASTFVYGITVILTTAKQEAFEESIRLKNQFRNLDEDEVEFLDSVLESTRAKEDAVKKETAEQLNLFRRQQAEADKATLNETGVGTDHSTEPGAQSGTSSAEAQWAINARKRKRVKDKEILSGVKLRRASSTSEKPATPVSDTAVTSHAQETSKLHDSPEATVNRSKNQHITGSKIMESPQKQAPDDSPKPIVGALGLAGYSSDEDA